MSSESPGPGAALKCAVLWAREHVVGSRMLRRRPTVWRVSGAGEQRTPQALCSSLRGTQLRVTHQAGTRVSHTEVL